MFEVNGFPNVKQPVKTNNTSGGVTTKKINVSNTSFTLVDGLYETLVSHGLGVEPANVIVTDVNGETLYFDWKASGLNQVKIAIVEKIDVKVTVIG